MTSATDANYIDALRKQVDELRKEVKCLRGVLEVLRAKIEVTRGDWGEGSWDGANAEWWENFIAKSLDKMKDVIREGLERGDTDPS